MFAIRAAVKDIKERGMGDSPPAEDNSGSPRDPADSPPAEDNSEFPVLTVEDAIAALTPAMDNAIAALNRALGAQSTPPVDLDISQFSQSIWHWARRCNNSMANRANLQLNPSTPL